MNDHVHMKINPGRKRGQERRKLENEGELENGHGVGKRRPIMLKRVGYFDFSVIYHN